jgi:hypothetical protein
MDDKNKGADNGKANGSANDKNKGADSEGPKNLAIKGTTSQRERNLSNKEKAKADAAKIQRKLDDDARREKEQRDAEKASR